MRLAAHLVANVEPGRRREKPFDLVKAIDDVELDNMAQPQRPVHHVREAVRAHIGQTPWPSLDTQRRAAERVRERCSFHLLSPMVESYFFAETGQADKPSAILRAGAVRPAQLDPATQDVEAFLVADPAFLGVPDDHRYPDAKRSKIPWAKPQRAQHPKHYLRFLCDPDIYGTERRPYRETQGGCRALERLDWAQVVAHAKHTTFARAFLEDLADGLGMESPVPPGDVHGETRLKLHHPGRVLRNL